MSASPASVRRYRTMLRLRAEDAAARYERQRRDDARRHGYLGPLTRDEAAAMALADLAALANGR